MPQVGSKPTAFWCTGQLFNQATQPGPAHSPFNICRHLASATSHRRMVRSQEVLAKRRPSGEKRQNFTGPGASDHGQRTALPPPPALPLLTRANFPSLMACLPCPHSLPALTIHLGVPGIPNLNLPICKINTQSNAGTAQKLLNNPA